MTVGILVLVDSKMEYGPTLKDKDHFWLHNQGKICREVAWALPERMSMTINGCQSGHCTQANRMSH